MVIETDDPPMIKPKEVVYVYCAEMAKEILAKERNIELNCVKQEQQVCSSDKDIDAFYGDGHVVNK